MLLYVFKEGYAEHRPPYNNYQYGNFIGKHALVQKQHYCNGYYEGNGAAADIAHCIAPGGHPVHALRRGNVRQEGIIEKAASGKAYARKYEAHEHQPPVLKRRHHGGEHKAKHKESGEKLLFHAGKVAYRAEYWRKHRHNERRRADGEAVKLVAGFVRLHGEIDGEYGRHNIGGIDGIGPIIHYP